MKRLIVFLALTSCISTEIIGYELEKIDTVVVERSKPHKPLPPIPPTDTTDGREPIGFNPTVEG